MPQIRMLPTGLTIGRNLIKREGSISDSMIMKVPNPVPMRWIQVTNGVRSDLDDTDSNYHLGMQDGKKGKVSLPDLNEKSTTNDTWIWRTDMEQYLRDGWPKCCKELVRNLVNGRNI